MKVPYLGRGIAVRHYFQYSGYASICAPYAMKTMTRIRDGSGYSIRGRDVMTLSAK